MNVSIIIPTYNVAPYICKCLKSVAAQTFTGIIECLIVDDCGIDNSIQIAEEFIREYTGSIQFRIIYREKNGGLSAARNSGIRKAKGEYLYFLDSDDCIFPDCIHNMWQLVEKYPGVDMVQGNCEEQGKFGFSYLHFDETQLQPYYKGRDAESFLLLKCPPTAWNKLIKRNVVVDNNLYFVEGILHEDEMWRWDIHHYVKSIAIAYHKTYWYRRDNATSIMSTRDLSGSMLSKIEIIKRLIMALDTTVVVDTLFVFEFASPSVKSKYWSSVRDKEIVGNKIIELQKVIQSLHLPWYIRFQIHQWLWPSWITKTIIYKKCCYEYEKWCKANYFK